MIEIRECEDREVWDNFILDNGGHPLQLWGWGALKAKHGWRAERLLGYEFEEPVAAVSILTRKLPAPFRAYSYVPRGPVGDRANSGEFLEEVASYVKRRYHSVCLSIEPDSHEFDNIDLWKQSPNSILPSVTIQLDLTKTDSELLAAMSKTTRYNIRRSAVDVEIKKVKTSKQLEDCLNVYRHTSKRAGFELHSEDYYRDVHNILDDHSVIFAAYHQGELVAFVWLAVSGKTAYELYAGMTEAGSKLRSNYALKWHAISECKRWGLEVYDLGGILETGIAAFKRSWTDKDTTLAGTFDRPLSPLYSLWVSLLPKAKKTAQKTKKLLKSSS